MAGDQVDMNASDHHGMRHRRLTELKSLSLCELQFNVKSILQNRFSYAMQPFGGEMQFTPYSKRAGSMIPVP